MMMFRLLTRRCPSLLLRPFSAVRQSITFEDSLPAATRAVLSRGGKAIPDPAECFRHVSTVVKLMNDPKAGQISRPASRDEIKWLAMTLLDCLPKLPASQIVASTQYIHQLSRALGFRLTTKGVETFFRVLTEPMQRTIQYHEIDSGNRGGVQHLHEAGGGPGGSGYNGHGPRPGVGDAPEIWYSHDGATQSVVLAKWKRLTPAQVTDVLDVHLMTQYKNVALFNKLFGWVKGQKKADFSQYDVYTLFYFLATMCGKETAVEQLDTLVAVAKNVVPKMSIHVVLLLAATRGSWPTCWPSRRHWE